jgi:Cys-tRNA(Pro)/Cys-tRNA(Cys) deacylase
MATGKTNAVRIVEAAGLQHAVLHYQCDDNAIDAVSVALSINAEAERVFKTLLAIGDKSGPCVFCLPGNFELHLKKAATVSGNKKVEMLPVKDLLQLTGYVRGGCSPLGMKKRFPTFIDETAMLFDSIYVSAGVRGQQLLIAPTDLAGLIEAEFVEIT